MAGMLAERDFEPPWSWPREATITSVRSEISEATDDIHVTASHGGRAYLQAKNSTTLSAAADSEFAKAIAGFVGQYLDCRKALDGRVALDRERDRLVLVAGNTASGSIREHLRSVLDRIHDWPAASPLDDAARNAPEQDALSKTIAHVNVAFTAREEPAPDDATLRELLSLIYVFTLDFAGGDGHAQREALGLLRTTLLDAGRAGEAWNALTSRGVQDSAGQSGLDLRGAQRVLARESIALRAPRSYREDIQKLSAYTLRTLADLEDLADIELHDRRIKIDRETPERLAALVRETSCLLIGDPGAGKTATLYELLAGRPPTLQRANRLRAKPAQPSRLIQHLKTLALALARARHRARPPRRNAKRGTDREIAQVLLSQQHEHPPLDRAQRSQKLRDNQPILPRQHRLLRNPLPLTSPLRRRTQTRQALREDPQAKTLVPMLAKRTLLYPPPQTATQMLLTLIPPAHQRHSRLLIQILHLLQAQPRTLEKTLRDPHLTRVPLPQQLPNQPRTEGADPVRTIRSRERPFGSTIAPSPP